MSNVNVKSKVLKIRNLPTDGRKIDQINAKPYLVIAVFLFIGIALLFTRVYLIGIVITFLFLYCLLFVKDVVLIEFYETYAVLYLNNGKEECFLLFWQDVAKWSITSSRNDLDVLNIELKNHQCISLKCVSRKKVEKYFLQYATPIRESEITKQHAL